MFSLSLAQLRAHTSRLLATCLAIIIAVGFVVATLVLNQTTKSTVDHAVAARYQSAATVVAVNDQVPDSQPLSARSRLADQLGRIPGVRAVAVDRSTFVQARLPGTDGYRQAQLTGVAPDRILQWQRLSAGRLPTAAGEVAVGEQQGVHLGDRAIMLIELPAANGDSTEPVARSATIVGLVDLKGLTGPAGPGTEQLFSTAAQAQAWGATEPDEIRVAATAGTDPGTLTRRIATTLTRSGQQNLVVHSGTEQTRQAAAEFTKNAASLTQVLLIFATVAVLVCALVIANTFAVLLAQRTRELALLRCVGASSRQLRRGVLIESLVIGTVASAVGVLAGIALAAAVSTIGGRLETSVPLSGVSVPAVAVVAGMAIGIVITVLAAFAPARRATRVAPLAALRPQDPAPARSRSGLVRRGAGIALLAPSALILAYGAVNGSPLIALCGGLFSFVAVILLAQWVVPPAVALAGRLFGPRGGVPGRLAASNALRNPQRTAATATALIIGVTLTATMVVGAASTRATATHGLDHRYPTDVVVQDTAGRPLPGGMQQALAAVPHVAAAVALPGADLKGPDGQDLSVLGIDPARAATVVRSAAGAGVPAPGTISVSVPEAASWGPEIVEGSRVRLSHGTRSLELRVHFVSVDTPDSITGTDLARLAPAAGTATVWVKLADGLDADGRADALNAITAAATDLSPGSYADASFQQRDSFNRLVNALLLIVTGLLGIAVLIAVIGVGNTMALSVLERRQESGLLRALGLTRIQLRWMLLWEAVLIAGVASVLGSLLGIVYGALGTDAVLSGQTSLQLHVPWLQLLAIVLVATGAGALASVLPSRRAARISPVAAIAA